LDQGIPIIFARDHYNHRDLKTEWWYFAGIGAVEEVGWTNYHVSFFRKFSSHLKKDIYFGHFGLNMNGEFKFQEKRGDYADSSDSRLHFFIDDWYLSGFGDRYMTILDKGTSFVHLAKKRPIIHGPGYYSITDMDVKGRVEGKKFEGKGWFDHEFTNVSGIQLLTMKYIWLALQFAKGMEIMLYVMPQTPAKSFGSIIFPDGGTYRIFPGDYCLRNGSIDDPWILELPYYGISVFLKKKAESKITGFLGPNYTEGIFDIFSRGKIGQGFFEITEGGE